MTVSKNKLYNIITADACLSNINLVNETNLRDEIIMDAFKNCYTTSYETSVLTFGSDQVELLCHPDSIESAIQTVWSDNEMTVSKTGNEYVIDMPNAPQVKRRYCVEYLSVDPGVIGQVNSFLMNWWDALRKFIKTALSHLS